MSKFTKLAALALGLGVALTTAGAASANTGWNAHHPRRAEVNARLTHLDHRIGVERRHGELSGAQARDLRAEVRGVRGQERFDALRHGGHIARGEQRRLNHEETGIGRQVGR
jgi:hypothetical protein